MDFEASKDKWLELIKTQKIKDAEKVYWEELFPDIEKRFIKNTKIDQKYDWLILPAGLESSYYVMLIKSIKPKNVYFIGTKEFKDNFLDKIIEKTSLKASQYMIDAVDYEGMDVAEVYEKIRHHLDLFAGKKVIMDLTRGKRILSVGAGIVGSFFGFDLVYIDEEWIDDVKRGVPGTEILVMLKNPFDVFGDLEGKEARRLFNHHNYAAAKFFLNKLREKIADPREIEIEEILAEIYLRWNSFNFKAAFKKMELVFNKIKQYGLKRNTKNLQKNYEALKILGSIGDKKPEDLDNNCALHLIVDLYTNALRKSELGMFEDAITRLYRLIELISQFRLAKQGIVTSQPKIEQYEKEFKEITKKLDIERGLPSELGLKDGHIILFILKDKIWEDKSVEDLRKFCSFLRVRDTSIIAHGLQLAGEKAFKNLNNIAKDFIDKICKDFNIDKQDLIQQHTFIKL